MKVALFNMGAHIAPGLDDFNLSFFQHNWNNMSKDLLYFVLGIFLGKESIRRVNGTCLALTPKVNLPQIVSQFHPIGL